MSLKCLAALLYVRILLEENVLKNLVEVLSHSACCLKKCKSFQVMLESRFGLSIF